MKKLLLAFVLISSLAKSQSCSQAGFSPTNTYSTGTTSSFTVPSSTSFLYLCPSSTVFDTVATLYCRQVIVNPGAYYVVKYKPCGGNVIYAKQGGTVNISGTSTSAQPIVIFKEIGATIINSSTVTVNTTTCTSITTPSAINCSTATMVYDLKDVQQMISVYPNPANEKLTIEALWGNSFDHFNISLTNLLGSVVYDKKAVSGQKLEIDLKDLQSGVYYLSVNSAGFKETRKIIISR